MRRPLAPLEEHIVTTLAERGDAQSRAAWARHLPPGRDLGSVDLLAAASLPRAWRRHWEADGAAVALIDCAVGERTVSRGELAQRTEALAGALQRLGVARGERVLISAGSSANLVFLYVAALRLGAVVVPANIAYREREIAHVVGDCQPILAIMDDPVRAAWARGASRLGADLPVVDPAQVEELVAGAPRSRAALDAAGSDDLAMICYTSGTTGTPKGAILTHGNLLASAEAIVLAWRWTERDGLVLALPLFHIHGLGVGVHGSLLSGGRILLLPRFDPARVLRACARSDATMFFGVPTMYVRLVEALRDAPEGASALARLRLLVSGSAPLVPAVWEQMRRLTGQEILERYGMTETIMNVSNPFGGERRPGTVGLPLPGVELRIGGEHDATTGSVDQDEHTGDSSAAIGAIYLRGPNVFAGYWNRPEATAEVLDSEGWLRTGDMGWRSADGYVTIAGRSKELIITGGYNVYPREVEDVIEEHPAVREAAVAGRPSHEWGEEVVAFIVPTDAGNPPPGDEVIAWCRERLAPYKCPRHVACVDAIPRNALGKIVRGALSYTG